MPRWTGWGVAWFFVVLIGCQATSRPTPPMIEEEWHAVDGRRISVADWANYRAVVLVFLGRECPISNAYAPEMRRLNDEYASRGILWLGLHPDPDVSETDARTHAEEYGLPFPVILDADRHKARRFGATKMPEAVVVTPDGRVVYRGRIDDRYYDLGRSRGTPTRHDLREVLNSILENDHPPTSHAPAIGCDIERPQP